MHIPHVQVTLTGSVLAGGDARPALQFFLFPSPGQEDREVNCERDRLVTRPTGYQLSLTCDQHKMAAHANFLHVHMLAPDGN